ncbi:hypothetical protein, partial [Leisingera sp. HS039]|uniref:hypothetical protein n=1 Tax=Leisingera sp. HS039 TaxID=2818496 RepID=UPI001B3A0196
MHLLIQFSRTEQVTPSNTIRRILFNEFLLTCLDIFRFAAVANVRCSHDPLMFSPMQQGSRACGERQVSPANCEFEQAKIIAAR